MSASTLLLPKIVALVEEAAVVVMRFYATEAAVSEKADASPVTAADEAAEAILVRGLRELTPEIPLVAEEAMARGDTTVDPATAEVFWLVDPLDGTKEFIKKNGKFTLNVSLVEAGRPILGVVAAPAIGAWWWGARSHGAVVRVDGETRTIEARCVPASGPVAMVSRSHGSPEEEAFLAAEGAGERKAAGSSLKFCRVAEGLADLYPRFGRTMEWDTCAAQAVLEAAGGRVTTRDGARLVYGKPGFANDDGFIARGRAGGEGS